MQDNLSHYPRPHLEPKPNPKCPQCGRTNTRKLSYIWWGGVLAAKAMSLTRCYDCRCLFNHKTGLPSRKAIIVFNVVSVAIAILATLAVWRG